MNPKQSARRRFLKSSAALAGLAVGASASAGPLAAEPPPERIDELHEYGERSHFVNSVRTGSINNPERRFENEPVAFGLRTPLQDSVGMITPASLHFIVSHGFEPPDIDPQEHRLLIHGMVDRPLIFTVDELKRLPSVSRFHFIECHGNSTTAGPGGPTRIAPNATAQDTHGIHQLQPMDRGAAVPAAQGGRRAKRRDLDRGGRRRREISTPRVFRWRRPWTTRWWPTVKMASRCARSRVFRCGWWFRAGKGSTT